MPIPLLLHGRHAEGAAVTYEPLGPWIVPSHLDDPAREYEALRRGAGLIDYSTQAVIELQGADRAEFLHRLLTNTVRGLAPGQGCRAALLTPNGKLIADLIVLAEAQSHWVLCEVTRAELVRETLDRYVFTDDVPLIAHERRWAALAIQGPQALDAACALFPSLQRSVTLYAHQRVEDQLGTLWIVGANLTGHPGLLCFVDAARAHAAWDDLARRGAPHGLHPVGWTALNICRIEAGIPWFGFDIDDTNLLPETGLERIAVSDTKGCYIGQEIVARMATYGSANKKLVSLAFEEPVEIAPGAEVLHEEAPAGQITSACISPALNRSIALAMVKRGAYDVGTRVTVRSGGSTGHATVTEGPLVPGLVSG